MTEFDRLPEAGASTPHPARTTAQLLLDRDFGILFWGKLASIVGIWAFLLVTVTLAYDLTGSATWVGVVGAAQLVPQLGLAMAAGQLADRRGPLVPIVGGVTISGVSALVLALWLALVGPAGSEWVLLAASVAFGCGLALSAPAMHSVVPRLVSREELPAAVALNFLPTALGRAVGPALGALVTAVAGSTASLLAIAGVSLVSAVAFACARVPRAVLAEKTDTRIRASLAYVRREPPLTALLVGVAMVAVGTEPSISLAPVLVEHVGQRSSASGVVVTAFGIGGLLGVVVHRLLARRWRPAPEGVGAVWVLSGAVAVTAFAGSLGVLAAAAVVAGVCSMVGITAFSVAVQERCRPDMIGRVMALWVLAFAGARPFASFLQGLGADHLGTTATLAATAVVVAASGVWLTRHLRHHP